MILERSMHPGWYANTYLVADRPGGTALFVDSGAPLEPLLRLVERRRLTVTHLLVTHHHGDHTAGNGELQHRFGLEIVDKPCAGFISGRLEVEVLPTPGHSADSLSFVVSSGSGSNRVCFTGDTLFAGSVGGSGFSFDALRRSIMDVLLALPSQTSLFPGHGQETSVEREVRENPFVRIWRGVDHEGSETCTVAGEKAQLVLWARDYDGGFKAWVRFEDGSDQIVGGSAVRR